MRPIIHVVPHTHWDREWYHTAARFQLRLARLVDRLLDLLDAGQLPSFLLDGQGIVLDDYAAARPARPARPARLARLARHLAAGRIEAGPWYVLADNLLVSGEAIVRNLIEGGKSVSRYGGKAMPVGYAPDAFGHPAALPTILAGFGIRTAVTWRGFGGERGQEQDLYRWRGPDGSEVLMIHLPAPGYEYGADLPVAPREAARRWAAMRAMLEPRARSPHWLVLNGADHHAPQENLKDAVRALETANSDSRFPIPDSRFLIGSLGDYARAIDQWSRRHADAVPAITGELREGRAHAWALQGTHGTRLYLKQRNAECQRLFERIAEPLAALALRRREDLRPELEVGWRTLLENHAHDSICGTSSDDVHREMLTRFDRSRTMAIETADRALDVVTGRDADAARTAGRAAWQPHLLVFNTVAWSGGRRLVEAEVALFRRDIPVGPGSARRRAAARAPGALVLRDAGGRVLPYQELSRDVGTDLVEAPGHYPDCEEVEWRRVLFQAEDLPALGVTHVSVEALPTHHAPRTTHLVRRTPHSAPRTTHPVSVRGVEITSQHLALRIESDGTIAALDGASGASYHGLGALEDESDVGDSYTPAPRGLLSGAPDHVAVRVVHEGPLRGQLEVVRRYDAADLEVTMFVALEARSRAVSLAFEGVNLRFDHRLRVVFPTGARRPRVLADGPFGPVERSSAVLRARAGDTERPTPTAPMQRWVAVAKGARGLAVVTDGLPQYEARPDGSLRITLLRACGALSKADLRERPGHAGWPVPAIEGQCIGPFAGRMALRLTNEAAFASPEGFDNLADSVLVPPLARMQRACLRPPARVAGPLLEGAGLVFSAMKPAERVRGIILRCYNVRPETVRGVWMVPWPVASAKRCRIDETPVAALPVARRGVIGFDAGPREVVTILIR